MIPAAVDAAIEVRCWGGEGVGMVNGGAGCGGCYFLQTTSRHLKRFEEKVDVTLASNDAE
jgi:hypothetical protein